MNIVGSAVLLIGCNVLYHVCQKSIPTEVNPIVAAAGTYFIALTISFLLLPLFVSIRDLFYEVKKFNWASVVAGISIVGILIGHIIFYRSGWSLSTGTLFSYVAICMLLIPVGLIIFREKVNFYNIIGIIVCIFGLFLLTKK